MKFSRNAYSTALALIIALVIFVTDRLTKVMIQHGLNSFDDVPVIPGLLRITHAENTGAAFGILAEGNPILRALVLHGVTFVVICFVAAALWRRSGPYTTLWSRFALGLVLGGALGNFLDRVTHGSVTDFIEVFHGSWTFPAFNVADSAISVGGAMLVLEMLWPRSRPQAPLTAGLSGEKITNLAVYCAMAGILGAKLFMILFDWPEYLRNPRQILTMETLQAAGVFHGGFIVALLFATFYIRRQQLPVLKTMDVFAPGIAIGQSIGRLGCFAAGCCWGKACDLPWGVRVRSNFASPVPLDQTLHPVQLYESAADLLLFLFLYRHFARTDKPGQVIGLYLVLYSTIRFVIEFFREHEQALVGPFSLTQWIALALLLLGLVLLLRAKPRYSFLLGT